VHLIVKIIRVSRAKFHCNKLTTVRDIQDYASVIFATHCTFLRFWLICTVVYLLDKNIC